ncbi:uncharacterized protein LOC141712443 [Apium graveolens]|uniref:uncharacterized protein LOC141712443 n=1 Tax=Apium graveolens TaxID=4045 RepID=UPI003D7A5826
MQNNDEILQRGQEEPRMRENIQDQNGNMPQPQPQGEGRRDPPPHPGGNQGEFQQVAEQPQQPNVQTIPRAQLPAGYRNTTNDLRFHGNSDPVEFLGHFNIEMDVYQVPDLAQCRLLAATFREGAQQWFQKLGPAGLRVGTDFWKHLQGKVPMSLADVLAQAESFKAIEQSLAETKKNDNTHNSKGRSKRRDRSLSPDYRQNARSPNRVNTVSSRREWSPPSNYERRINNYTPLAASIDHIFEVKRRRGIDDKAKDERQPLRAEDVEKIAEVKFQRAGSIRAIFGGHPFVGDSNRALERNAREARHPPLTNIHSLEDRPPKVFKGESADITFKEKESRWVYHPHNDALVITMLIGAKNVHRVFLDNGSSTNILYYSTYKKLGFPDSDMYFEDAHVYGFTGEAVRVMGSVRLPVTLGKGDLSVTQMIYFKVLVQDSAHNVLVGRPWLRAFRVITSIHHLMIKFPTPNGVGSLRGSQYESRDCYHKAVKEFCRRRYEGKGLPFEDVEDIHTKLSGEVHAHYFVEGPEEEETYVSRNSFLTLGHVSKIRSVEEVVVSHAEEIIQKEVNREKLEGRSEILQGLGNNFKVDAPQKKDVPLRHENGIEVDAPPNEDAPSDAKVEVEDPRDFDFDLDPRIPMPAEKTGPTEDTISILVDKNNPSKVLKVGSRLDDEMRGSLTRFLIVNLDVFAWSHSDMIGIDPEVMCHRLNIFPNCKGIRQKRRPVSGERAIALKEEVDRLLEVGLIKESFYPEWLANPVLVKKPNGKWRTCVDFTYLNKACPKDSFPLPRIDQLVDATAGHALLSFMDAYFGYNQIPMYGPDQEHASFITDRGLYCYIGMPFGLINVGATYQRLVKMMFKDQIGRTMEVYVDDMLVKSEVVSDHIKHLMEMFNILRRFRMKLNPQKCVFGVESGKFLGFIVNHRGIEANPAKIKALLDMKSPTNVKQVQSLTGRIAALNRFVSKSSDRCKEFFKAIKLAGKDFVWTSECEEAFKRIKEQLGNPPMLSKPLDGESLILYLAVSEYSISAVLVREEDGQQSPVYYVSKRLHDAETRYTGMEKLVYALILASRKLRPYFQAHRIEVRMAYPLRQVLHKPESSGRMLKWAVELGQFDLEYVPRTTIKGQALADFLLEFNSEVDDKALVTLHPPHAEESLEEFPHPWWILHVDGAVNNGGAGAGIMLVSPEGHHLMSAIHFKFYATNNDVEYEALINGLKIALEMGVRNLIARSDSELVVNQVRGGFQVRGPRTEVYLRCTQRLIGMFKEVRLECVPREKNSNADALAKMGSQQEAVCSLAMKVLCQGYYWPTMKEDATNFVRACDRCQRFANYSSMPATLLMPMVSPWPFAMWGIDLIGELPKAKGDVKYAVVAVDYFTKWVEAMPLATITAKKIRDFVFNSIVCRFGIPYKLVSDNGKQFDRKELRQLCEELKIKKEFTAVYHPQSNGHTEAVNKIIKHTLKTKLEERKGNWPEELPKVMWSYNTTPRSTTGETSFMLTYGYEAMVPVEVGSGSLRRDCYRKKDAEVNQRLHLDLLEETRENSQLRLAAYQQRVARYYNKKGYARIIG